MMSGDRWRLAHRFSMMILPGASFDARGLCEELKRPDPSIIRIKHDRRKAVTQSAGAVNGRLLDRARDTPVTASG